MKKSEESTKIGNSEKAEVLIHFQTNDSEKSEDLKNNLKRQLIEYEDVNILKFESEVLPDGAMPADAFTIGAIALAVLPTLLPTIINAIKDIKLKNRGTSINIKVKNGDREIQLEIPADSISMDEVTALTDSYLEKLKK